MIADVGRCGYGRIVDVQCLHHHGKIIVRSPGAATDNEGGSITAPRNGTIILRHLSKECLRGRSITIAQLRILQGKPEGVFNEVD